MCHLILIACLISRDLFEFMVGQFKEKNKSRHGKGDTFGLQQLKAACDEYDDAASLCVFRVESLKQGQSRSLFTQAARHHAAQVFFCSHNSSFISFNIVLVFMILHLFSQSS